MSKPKQAAKPPAPPAKGAIKQAILALAVNDSHFFRSEEGTLSGISAMVSRIKASFGNNPKTRRNYKTKPEGSGVRVWRIEPLKIA